MKDKITSVKRHFFSAVIISFAIMLPNAYAGKIKCWTNKDGVKECGQYVPPEYSQKRIETRNKSGQVIDVDERAKTKEELEQEAALEAERKKQEALVAEQKRKDDILLKTFSSVRDINLLRDNKLNVIEGMISVTRGNNKVLENKLEKLQKQAANLERSGKKPPETLLTDMQVMERQIKNNNSIIAKHREEQQVIRQEYEGYTKRFLLLKGKPPTDNPDQNAAQTVKPKSK